MTVKANAKINLALNVESKRNDGYHNIDTVMQTINIYDTIAIKKQNFISVKCGSICDEKNIAFKAAKLFFMTTGVNAGANIEITKNIPKAAGLGGGSADAAAVLCALDKLYGTHLSYSKLCLIAKEIGADVPFLINGGTQRAQGIGEILTPLKPLENIYFVIVKKGIKPSTCEMFMRLDEKNYPSPNIQQMVSAIENRDLNKLKSTLCNSFSALWETSEIENELLKSGAFGSCLSGSGPSVFGMFLDKETALSAVKTLSNAKIECYFANSCKSSIIFE